MENKLAVVGVVNFTSQVNTKIKGQRASHSENCELHNDRNKPLKCATSCKQLMVAVG